MAIQTIEIPAAPSGLPAAVEKRWKEVYEAAHREAQNDEPELPSIWGQVAIRAANKTLKVADPKSHADALKLEAWQIAHRAEKDTVNGRVLNVVTRDGKKFSFPVPAKAATKTDEQKNGAGKPEEKTGEAGANK